MIYVGLSKGNPYKKYVCQKCEGEIMWPKHAHAQSQFWAVKTDPYYSFQLYAGAALALMEKNNNKRSLRNEKLKAYRAE